MTIAGTQTFVAANGDRLFLSFTGTGMFTGAFGPGQTSETTATYTVTGGKDGSTMPAERCLEERRTRTGGRACLDGFDGVARIDAHALGVGVVGVEERLVVLSEDLSACFTSPAGQCVSAVLGARFVLGLEVHEEVVDQSARMLWSVFRDGLHLAVVRS